MGNEEKGGENLVFERGKKGALLCMNTTVLQGIYLFRKIRKKVHSCIDMASTVKVTMGGGGGRSYGRRSHSLPIPLKLKLGKASL